VELKPIREAAIRKKIKEKLDLSIKQKSETLKIG